MSLKFKGVTYGSPETLGKVKDYPMVTYDKSEKGKYTIMTTIPANLHYFVEVFEEGKLKPYRLIYHQLGDKNGLPNFSEYQGSVETVIFFGHISSIRAAFEVIRQLPQCNKVRFFLGEERQDLVDQDNEDMSGVLNSPPILHVKHLSVLSREQRTNNEYMNFQFDALLRHGVHYFTHLEGMDLNLPESVHYYQQLKEHLPKWKCLKQRPKVQMVQDMVTVIMTLPQANIHSRETQRSKSTTPKKITLIPLAVPSSPVMKQDATPTPPKGTCVPIPLDPIVSPAKSDIISDPEKAAHIHGYADGSCGGDTKRSRHTTTEEMKKPSEVCKKKYHNEKSFNHDREKHYVDVGTHSRRYHSGSSSSTKRKHGSSHSSPKRSSRQEKDEYKRRKEDTFSRRPSKHSTIPSPEGYGLQFDYRREVDRGYQNCSGKEGGYKEDDGGEGYDDDIDDDFSDESTTAISPNFTFQPAITIPLDKFHNQFCRRGDIDSPPKPVPPPIEIPRVDGLLRLDLAYKIKSEMSKNQTLYDPFSAYSESE